MPIASEEEMQSAVPLKWGTKRYLIYACGGLCTPLIKGG